MNWTHSAATRQAFKTSVRDDRQTADEIYWLKLILNSNFEISSWVTSLVNLPIVPICFWIGCHPWLLLQLRPVFFFYQSFAAQFALGVTKNSESAMMLIWLFGRRNAVGGSQTRQFKHSQRVWGAGFPNGQRKSKSGAKRKKIDKGVAQWWQFIQ